VSGGCSRDGPIGGDAAHHWGQTSQIPCRCDARMAARATMPRGKQPRTDPIHATVNCCLCWLPDFIVCCQHVPSSGARDARLRLDDQTGNGAASDRQRRFGPGVRGGRHQSRSRSLGRSRIARALTAELEALRASGGCFEQGNRTRSAVRAASFARLASAVPAGRSRNGEYCNVSASRNSRACSIFSCREQDEHRDRTPHCLGE